MDPVPITPERQALIEAYITFTRNLGKPRLLPNRANFMPGGFEEIAEPNGLLTTPSGYLHTADIAIGNLEKYGLRPLEAIFEGDEIKSGWAAVRILQPVSVVSENFRGCAHPLVEVIGKLPDEEAETIRIEAYQNEFGEDVMPGKACFLSHRLYSDGTTRAAYARPALISDAAGNRRRSLVYEKLKYGDMDPASWLMLSEDIKGTMEMFLRRK